MESPSCTELMWQAIVRSLKDILSHGKYKNATEMAKDIGVPAAALCRWISGQNRCKTLHSITLLIEFLESSGIRLNSEPEPTGGKSIINDVAIARKAEIIARELEIALPLMSWFAKSGTKEHRDYLRRVLGTELSYDIFKISQILLTENHHDKAKSEGAV